MKNLFLLTIVILITSCTEDINICPEIPKTIDSIFKMVYIDYSIEDMDSEITMIEGILFINNDYFDGQLRSKIYADIYNDIFIKIKVKDGVKVGAIEIRIPNESMSFSLIKKRIDDEMIYIEDRMGFIWYSDKNSILIWRIFNDSSNKITLIDLAKYTK